MRDRHDVAIVGYGPVGQTLAILLGQRGWNVGVFEKQPVAYPLPRAVHFDHEVARILQAAGVADRLATMTESGDAYEWRDAAGGAPLRVERRGAAGAGGPEANMCAQPELERLLDERARSVPTVEVNGDTRSSVSTPPKTRRCSASPSPGAGTTRSGRASSSAATVRTASCAPTSVPRSPT